VLPCLPELQILRTRSPRTRGYDRLGMTSFKELNSMADCLRKDLMSVPQGLKLVCLLKGSIAALKRYSIKNSNRTSQGAEACA
jgi:hypothetical protein